MPLFLAPASGSRFVASVPRRIGPESLLENAARVKVGVVHNLGRADRRFLQIVASGMRRNA